MSKLIYVETSVPSFYTETRENEDVRIRRKWTREWWHLPTARRICQRQLFFTLPLPHFKLLP
jgi:hypothetical protein